MSDQEIPVSAVEGSICERNEVDGFGEIINDGEDGSIPIQRGKASDEVHCDV